MKPLTRANFRCVPRPTFFCVCHVKDRREEKRMKKFQFLDLELLNYVVLDHL